MQTITFYSKIYVLGIHDGPYGFGPGSAVETPLPHSPGVRMTVVDLTPSNERLVSQTVGTEDAEAGYNASFDLRSSK